MGSDGRLGGMGPFLFGSAAMFATMYSTQAILPELGRAFGVSASASGLTVSVLIAALAVGAWIWGPLSDRIGRRRSLIVASTLLVVPTAAAAIAPTFPLLLAVRVAQGLCMPGLLTVGVPYIAEVYAPRIGSRAVGLYLSSLVAGGLVGRIGVALVTDVAGWRVALGVLALLPLAASLALRRLLPPEPVSGAAGDRVDRAAVGLLLRNRTLIAATVAGSSLFFGFVAAFTYVDYRLERPPFAEPPAAASLVFVLWIFGAVGPTAGRLAGRLGWRRIAFAALGLSAAGLVLALVSSLPLLVAGLALFALANFAGVTATQIGVAEATEQHRGVASALYYSTYYVAGGLGGYLPGRAYEAFGWSGVIVLALVGFAVGIGALTVLAGREARQRVARQLRLRVRVAA
jgi:MFS transporter, YNFM family, putative membrane transport protein